VVRTGPSSRRLCRPERIHARPRRCAAACGFLSS
jgi:hypothetical protein